MARRIYRLEVWYPEKLPKEPDESWGEYFRPWPRERCYLSLSGAEHRAAMLRQHGCDVVIVRSKPIEWETPRDAAAMVRQKAAIIRRRLERFRASL